jgi:leucyl aminopeptidase
VKAVAEAELAVNLVVLVPLTENMTTHSSPPKKIYKKFFIVKAVAEAELAVNLVVLVPLTENMTTHSSPPKKIDNNFVLNVKAVAEAELAVNLVVLVPLTENMPGGRATKPGDVVRAMNGKTIQVRTVVGGGGVL